MKRYHTYIILLFAFLLSCTNEDGNVVPVSEGRKVEINLNLITSAIRIPETRAINITDENKISDLLVLVFENGNFLDYRQAELSSDGQSATVTLLESEKSSKLVFLANTGDFGLKIVDDIDKNKKVSEATVLNQFVFDASADSDLAKIPMWSQEVLASGVQEMSLDVKLLRSMAKVNVNISGVATSKFQIKWIKIITNDKIQLVPSDPQWKTNPDGYYVTSVTIPDGASKTNYSQAEVSSEGAEYESAPIYVAEASAKDAAVIICGEYREVGIEPKDTYYRLNFSERTGADESKNLPILRNHQYTFNIANINGAGFLTEQEAIDSEFPSNTTGEIISGLEVYDDELYNDGTTDGQYVLSVSSSSLYLNGNDFVKLRIYTDCPDGWRLEYLPEELYVNHPHGEGHVATPVWLFLEEAAKKVIGKNGMLTFYAKAGNIWKPITIYP